MKKSNLRKIIRESIKGLMNEQLNQNVRCVKLSRCTPGGSPGFTLGNYSVNGQVPQLGQIIQKYGGPQGRFAIYNVLPFDPAGCGHNFGHDLQESTITDPCEACDNITGGCSSLTNPPSGCDNTMAGSCAQTWLPSNMNWPNMVNFACTGNQTYSALEQSQLVGATNLLNSNGFTGTIPSFSNYQDISNFVNSTGIGQPQKGQIKRKLAKSHWGGCMFTDCNC